MPKYICAASYIPEKTVNEDSNTVSPDFANTVFYNDGQMLC